MVGVAFLSRNGVRLMLALPEIQLQAIMHNDEPDGWLRPVQKRQGGSTTQASPETEPVRRANLLTPPNC